MRIVELEDTSNGANGCRWILVASPRLRADGAALPCGRSASCAGLLADRPTVCIGATGAADPVRGEATFSAAGGYARLVIKLAEDVQSEVTTAGSILVIRFKRPVDIPVDKLAEAVPDYVSSARRDPDGTAIRLSLARRVTINTMTAGERMFVDLLPDSWSGPPPQPAARGGARARRARARPPSARCASSAPRPQAKKRPPVRVRALGAADLRALRVRNARRRRRLLGAATTRSSR